MNLHFDLGSNETSRRDGQFPKQIAPITSTLAGISIAIRLGPKAEHGESFRMGAPDSRMTLKESSDDAPQGRILVLGLLGLRRFILDNTSKTYSLSNPHSASKNSESFLTKKRFFQRTD
jgi:hypothetical protein